KDANARKFHRKILDPADGIAVFEKWFDEQHIGAMLSTSLFASSKVCAAPQTWYRGSRPIIATKPCSLMMVSPTATTLYGSFPPRGLVGDITAVGSNKSACSRQ